MNSHKIFMIWCGFLLWVYFSQIEIMSYNSDDVRQHKDESSAWITHKGRVFDITEFLSRHPGGNRFCCQNLEAMSLNSCEIRKYTNTRNWHIICCQNTILASWGSRSVLYIVVCTLELTSNLEWKFIICVLERKMLRSLFLIILLLFGKVGFVNFFKYACPLFFILLNNLGWLYWRWWTT